jgi:phosphosulfolactate synthase
MLRGGVGGSASPLGAHPVKTAEYIDRLGVRRLPPRTCPLDPGYDPDSVVSHLRQSGHLMTSLKISTAGWLIADEDSTRRKFSAARDHGVPSVTGGTPFEVAVYQQMLPEYLDLCASLGATRVECARGFTEPDLSPKEIVAMTRERGLGLDVELGGKHSGAFTPETVDALVEEGLRWREAGTEFLVIEARESARDVGLFDSAGNFAVAAAERFVEAFGFDALLFEAPSKPSQFALLDHFGPSIQLSNVRLEELLRVEIYRRGLHADAFARPSLRFVDVDEEPP